MKGHCYLWTWFKTWVWRLYKRGQGHYHLSVFYPWRFTALPSFTSSEQEHPSTFFLLFCVICFCCSLLFHIVFVPSMVRSMSGLCPPQASPVPCHSQRCLSLCGACGLGGRRRPISEWGSLWHWAVVDIWWLSNVLDTHSWSVALTYLRGMCHV